MKKTLHINTTIEGIRMSVIEVKETEVKNVLLALFGRGNLQARMLLEAVATMERSFDLFEVEIVVEIDAADAASIKRVGHWLDKRTPAQQALIMHAKEVAVA